MQIFDTFINITSGPYGFNQISSLTNATTGDSEIITGSVDYNVYDVSDINAYGHFPKFNRSFYAANIANAEVN